MITATRELNMGMCAAPDLCPWYSGECTAAEQDRHNLYVETFRPRENASEAKLKRDQ